MQNYTRFVFRKLKYLNRNILFGHSSCCINTIGKSVSRCDETNIFFGNVLRFQQFTSQNVSPTLTKRRTAISNIDDIKQYISEGKQFYLKLLTNILDTLEFETISSKDAELLLECCGQSVADSSKQNRNNVCQKIYEKLLEHNKLNIDIYNTYIRICTENDTILNISDFLKSFKGQHNHNTYKLLLSNVCEKGDIQQMYKLLNLMKQDDISANEDIFNKLVLGYTINSGLKGGESVLLTMKTARVLETTQTKFAMLKGVVKRNSLEDLENLLSNYKMDLTESHILELVEALCLNGNVTWLPKIKKLYDKVVSREFLNDLEKLCIHLVHMGQSESAIIVYKEFKDPSPQQNYASYLLKEMLICRHDIDRIISIAKNLHDENLNIFALENVTRIALKQKYIDESWKLLENLNELRSHYFWPLLLSANEKDGENGLFSVMKKMIAMKVEIDSATLQFCILPFYDPKNFKYLIKKLSTLGITVSEMISPMLIVLIQRKELKIAVDLCNNYNVPISGENFLKHLSSAWAATKDKVSIVLLLQRYCEDNLTATDFVGEFLIATLNTCKTNIDFASYISLTELIHTKGLRIDSKSATILHNLCSTTHKSMKNSEKIRDQIDGLLNFELTSEIPHIPHPKDMKIDELECHLLELQEKRMGTRGALRKLILLHSSFGNLQRVAELRQQFLDAGYEETIGMKSSLMHSYVKGAHLEAALNIYTEIKTTNPNFELDSFKIIDLATLLIKENRFNEAMELMRTETKSKNIIGGPSIERNCKDLLNNFKNSDQQLEMFNLLVENGYCKPTNIILGPLVRIHLSRGDLQKAANVYINCSKKYKRTPLQLEIVRETVKSKDEALLQSILQATENVHGARPAQEVLIAALAENGQQNALIKLLTGNKFSCKKELEKRCERWIHEGKVEALQTLADACERLREEVVDITYVYNSIMQIFDLNGDIKGATEFYEKLQEKDIIISKDLEAKFNEMIKKFDKTNEKLRC